MKIGTFLRKFRDSKRLSCRYVAERIGVSHSSYLDWEHDKSSPSLKNYFRLSEVYEVDPSEFILYLTGKVSKISSIQDNIGSAELRELVRHYQGQVYFLKEEKLQLESELEKYRELQLNILPMESISE